jgi:hypothetical protein
MSVIVPLTKKCRSHTITWFGRVSYRKMKMTYEKMTVCCPLCGHELEDASYFGSAIIQTNCHKSDYRAKFWMPLKEDGVVVWQLSGGG